MTGKEPWARKLDAHSRLQAEEGLPPGGSEVTVRLAADDEGMARQVETAGLKPYTRVGEILVGHVARRSALRSIAQLQCVREVQVARPMYPDQEPPPPPRKD